jgi:quercetin dioxygenase-like cupin family protein
MRRNITMKRIRTSKPVGRPRFTYALIVCALIVATVGVGSGMAADKNSKVTLVYEHELPNVPGKSLRAVLVEYGPGGGSPSHRHPSSAFIYARVLEGAIRSKVNDAPERTYQAGESWIEQPGDHHQVSRNASTTAPAKLLAIFVVDTSDREIVIPDK